MTVTGASDPQQCRWQEVPTRFRAVFWALPHPFLPAHLLTESPNHCLIGLFRVLKCPRRKVCTIWSLKVCTIWSFCLFNATGALKLRLSVELMRLAIHKLPYFKG